MNFTHLHLHTHYSILDSMIKPKELFKKCNELNMKSVAITDHGTMSGALEFYTEAKKYDVKPIIGIEAYYVPGGKRLIKDKDNRKLYHIVLLAMNETGYRNLMRLSSLAYTEGFYYKPRIDRELLEKYNEGVICMSACIGGQLQQLIINGTNTYAKLKMLTESFLNIFGDRFYLELQRTGIKNQEIVLKEFLKLSKEMSIPLVATNDVHYLNEDDQEAHDYLICIGTNSKVKYPGRDDVKDKKIKTRKKFSGEGYYLKSHKEMMEVFKDIPEAIENTSVISDRCNLNLELKAYDLPALSENPDEELEMLAMKGLEEKYGKHPDYIDYVERMTMELDMIKSTGFSGYFLMVADYINWALEKNIPVGPGRGSGVSSLALNCIGITDIDPIKYDLPFERFLNPDRISMADIDTDFCMRRRDEVIDYVREKYGESRVAPISTFMTLNAKSAVRDVCRVHGLSVAEGNQMAEAIPPDQRGRAPKLEEVPEISPTFKKLITSSEDMMKVYDISKKVEGVVRNASVHASGIVVGNKDLPYYTPVLLSKDKEIATQYEMKMVEEAGLVKFDFLGLRNITVIDDTLKLVKKTRGIELTQSEIPDDDEKTFNLLCKGDHVGIFQIENSTGIKNLTTGIQPRSIDDIAIILALYRPGPIDSGFHDEYVRRKQKDSYIYPHEALKEILKPTYGLIIYQEQAMKICQTLAGFTAPEADAVRKAMGKKIKEEMDALKDKFITGCEKNGHDIGEDIWNIIEKFSDYLFNKSHSVAYATISYRTAYLKANYREEYMTSLLGSVKKEDIGEYVEDCINSEIEVLPPNIQESSNFPTLNGNKIIYGLSTIKGVGLSCSEMLLEERKKGKFKSLVDFINRTYSRTFNKRVVNSLIYSGALDCFGDRKQVFKETKNILKQLGKLKKKVNKSPNQYNMFTQTTERKSALLPDNLPYNDDDSVDLEDLEILQQERDVIGCYLSSHPLDMYPKTQDSVKNILGYDEGIPLEIKCLIDRTKIITDKRGRQMAFATVSDKTGTIDTVIFANQFSRYSDLLNEGEIVKLIGVLDVSRGKQQIKVSKIEKMEGEANAD